MFNLMIKSGDQLKLNNRMLLMHVKCDMLTDRRHLIDELSERNLVL